MNSIPVDVERVKGSKTISHGLPSPTLVVQLLQNPCLLELYAFFRDKAEGEQNPIPSQVQRREAERSQSQQRVADWLKTPSRSEHDSRRPTVTESMSISVVHLFP